MKPSYCIEACATKDGKWEGLLKIATNPAMGLRSLDRCRAVEGKALEALSLVLRRRGVTPSQRLRVMSLSMGPRVFAGCPLRTQISGPGRAGASRASGRVIGRSGADC